MSFNSYFDSSPLLNPTRKPASVGADADVLNSLGEIGRALGCPPTPLSSTAAPSMKLLLVHNAALVSDLFSNNPNDSFSQGLKLIEHISKMINLDFRMVRQSYP